MVTIHCKNCGKEGIYMLNAVCTWNVDKQVWEFQGEHDPLYQCNECFTDSVNYTEKEITNG